VPRTIHVADLPKQCLGGRQPWCRGGAPSWSGAALLLLAVAVWGCGGSEPTAEAPEPSGPPQAEEAPAAEDKEEPKAPKEKEEPKQIVEEEIETLPAEPEVEKPPRPEDVADWQPADYVSAKEDRDLRLVDAVAYLGEQGVGDEATATLLAGLLLVPEHPEPDPKPAPKAKPEQQKQEKSRDQDSADEGDEEDDEGGDMEFDEDDEDEGDEGDEEDDEGGDMEFDEDEEDEGDEGDEEDEGRRRAGFARPGSRSRGDQQYNYWTRMGFSSDQPVIRPSYVSLIGSIVGALGANRTDTSRRILEQLVAGTLETGYDEAATAAALKALVDHPCPENETLLLRALTASETLRPPGRGSVTAEQLRETALLLVKQVASPQLRFEVARYLFSANPSVELRSRLVEFIMASHPYNVMSQVAIYQRQQTGEQVKKTFERYFTTYSADALGWILGLSTGRQAPRQTSQQAVPKAAAAADSGGRWVAFGDDAARDTSPAPRRSPEEDEDEADSDEDDSDEMAFDESDSDEEADDEGADEESDYEGEEEGGGPRRPAGRALGQRQSSDTESAKAFERVARSDPDVAYELGRSLWSPEFCAAVAGALRGIDSLEREAQLVMLASTMPSDLVRSALYETLQRHWKEGPQVLRSAAAPPEQGIADPGFLLSVKMLPRKEPPATESARRPPSKRTRGSTTEPAAYDWMIASYDIARGLCDRFRAAAQAQESGPPDAVGLAETLPVKLHPNANVTAAYEADWLERVEGKLAGVSPDPLKIHYVRSEDTARYNTLLSFYKRQVRSAAEHRVQGGVWLDAHVVAEAGRRRSIDVLISRLDERQDRPATEEEPLVIEILSVEVKDPKGE